MGNLGKKRMRRSGINERPPSKISYDLECCEFSINCHPPRLIFCHSMLNLNTSKSNRVPSSCLTNLHTQSKEELRTNLGAHCVPNYFAFLDLLLPLSIHPQTYLNSWWLHHHSESSEWDGWRMVWRRRVKGTWPRLTQEEHTSGNR